MLTRKQLALVKIETTYGEDASPDGANKVFATNFDASPYEGDTQSRTRYRDYLGGYANVNVGPYSTLQITVPLAGSGSASTAPSYGPLLRACGLSETTGTGIITYQPVSDNFESCTIRYILDGQEHKLTGSRGTVVFNFATGEFPTAQFTMTGFYSHPTNPTAVSTSTVEQSDEIPVNARNTTINVHGYAACGQSLSIDMGNTVNYRNLIGSENVRISDRASTGQIQIDAPDLATKDYFDAVESHAGVTLGAANLVHGAVAGNIVTVNAPQSQLSSISNNDSDGIVQYQFDAQYLPNAGDDEFTLEFS